MRVLTLLLLWTPVVFAGTCEDYFLTAKTKIARLVLERNGLEDPALRSLLEQNVKAKLAEFKAQTGQDLGPHEIRALVEALGKPTEAQIEQNKQEEALRQKQNQKLGPWNLELKVLNRNFLPSPLGEETLDEIQTVNLPPNGTKILLKTRQTGTWHMVDPFSGDDVNFGQHEHIAFFNNSNTEYFVTVSDRGVQFLDPLTGGQASELRFNKKIKNASLVYPYKEASGRVAFLVADNEKQVFNVDSQNVVEKVGLWGEDEIVRVTRDRSRVLSYHVLAPEEAGSGTYRRKLVVRQWPTGATLMTSDLLFYSAIEAREFEPRDFIYHEDSHGVPRLAFHATSSPQITIFDLQAKHEEHYQVDRGFSRSAGGFVEDRDGELFFAYQMLDENSPAAIRLSDDQRMNFDELPDTVWLYEQPNVIPLENGAAVLYNLSPSRMSGPAMRLAALSVGSFKPLTQPLDLAAQNLGQLITTFTVGDRVFGVFSDGGLTMTRNMSLVELNGPEESQP